MNRKTFIGSLLSAVGLTLKAKEIAASGVVKRSAVKKSIGFPPPPKHLLMHDPNQMFGRITEVSITPDGIGYTVDKSITFPGMALTNEQKETLLSGNWIN